MFTLHESFKDNVVEIEKPPFSIVRNGWGEFDINVTIYFQDINEEPVHKIHGIRIFHPNQNQRATIKKPVVNEQYDEIVFCDPTEFFYHMLTDDINETLKAVGIEPVESTETKEETKADTKEEPQVTEGEELKPTEEKTEDKEMTEEKPEAARDVDMAAEESKDAQQVEQEKDIKEESNSGAKIDTAEVQDSASDEIIINSTYVVPVGAANEHKINVVQFFEEKNDKSDLKLLSDALKHLKEETEYLRNEVRN